MQLKGRRSLLLVLGVGLAWASPSTAETLDEDPQAGALLRVFTDSDHVSVRSLMNDFTFMLRGKAALNVHWNNERVVIPGIEAPVGSQEAVDAITTASRPISGNAYQDFIKVRNEFQSEVSRGPMAVRYYVSSESDYLAQQLGANINRDFNPQLNLSVGTSYGWDAIDPLADDDAGTGADRRGTLHCNAVATQVVTTTTLVRFGVEYNLVDGLQHNPYRNVYAGGGPVSERHPEHRQRGDAFVRVSQYLDNRASLKLHYRIYRDDWGIASHELGSKLSQYLTSGLSARYEYRYYTQSSADFYRDEYTSPDGVDGYRSGDYRMAALSSHLFGVALDLDLDAFQVEHWLMRHLALRFNYDRYFNSNNYSANILETGVDYRF